jgi:phage terminase Nu1 subunit (DNA packaging protein)
MPGLVPGIHVFAQRDQEDVDGRDKPGHDEKRIILERVLLKPAQPSAAPLTQNAARR